MFAIYNRFTTTFLNVFHFQLIGDVDSYLYSYRYISFTKIFLSSLISDNLALWLSLKLLMEALTGLSNRNGKKGREFRVLLSLRAHNVLAMPEHPPGLIALRSLCTRFSGLSFFPFFLLKRFLGKREDEHS